MTADAEIAAFYEPLVALATSDPVGALQAWHRGFAMWPALGRRDLRTHRQWFRKLRREALSGGAPAKVGQLVAELEALLSSPLQSDLALLRAAQIGAIEAEAAETEHALAESLDSLGDAPPVEASRKLAKAFDDFIEATERLAHTRPIDRDTFAAQLDRVQAVSAAISGPATGGQDYGLRRRLLENRIWHLASVGDLETLGTAFDAWRELGGAGSSELSALKVRRRVIHGVALMSHLDPSIADLVDAHFDELISLSPPESIIDPGTAVIVASAARDRAYARATRTSITTEDYEKILPSITVIQTLWFRYRTPELAVQLMATLRDRLRAASLISNSRRNPMAVTVPLLKEISAVAAAFPNTPSVVREHLESHLVVLDLASDFDSYPRARNRLADIAALAGPFLGEQAFDSAWAQALHLSIYAGCRAIITGAANLSAPREDLDLLDAVVARHREDAQLTNLRLLAHSNIRSAALSVAPSRVIYAVGSIDPSSE